MPASNGKRVAITSIGVVSSIGTGVEDFWSNLVTRKSGVKTLKSVETSGFGCTCGCEIDDLDVTAHLGNKGLRHLDKVTIYLLVAARLALQNGHRCPDTGVVIGTSFSGLHSIFEFERLALKEGPSHLNPMDFPNTVLNAAASRINIMFGLENLSETVCTGMCSGTDAIGYASKYIKNGDNSVILCGGGEELNEELLLGMHQRELLSGSKNGNNSEHCSKPFDKDRDGTVLGEGAALLLIESFEQAEKNGKKILAEIIGFSSNFDGDNGHRTAGRSSGAQRAIEEALQDAGLRPEDIDYVSASANGTSQDRVELEALRNVFGRGLETLPVVSIKPQVGECFGATGAMQAVAAVMSLNRKVLPPTLNFSEAEDGFGRLNISGSGVEKDVKTCLINSFSNFGHNSSLLVKKYE